MSREVPARAILGYSNRLTVRAGHSLDFKVSASQGASYSAQLVRLINGDTHSPQAVFKEEALNAPCNGEYQARYQSIQQGSYIVVDKLAALNGLDTWTLMLNMMPTLLASGQYQYLASQSDTQTETGWAL